MKRTNKTNPRCGSSLDNFLNEEGVYRDVVALAKKELLIWKNKSTTKKWEVIVPADLRSKFAIDLYSHDLLGFGKASELAGLTREKFAAELGRENISRHYFQEDLSMDAAFAAV
jgi:predicted HTH domain antitoxin